MSLIYSSVSVCSCSLSVVLTIYSKDQVTADLWLLQRSVNYTLLSITGFFVRILFAKNRVKSSHGFVTEMIWIRWSL